MTMNVPRKLPVSWKLALVSVMFTGMVHRSLSYDLPIIVEKFSNAYSGPRSLQPDGTLDDNRNRRYGAPFGGHDAYWGKTRYNNNYGSNLYVDENRWSGRGRITSDRNNNNNNYGRNLYVDSDRWSGQRGRSDRGLSWFSKRYNRLNRRSRSSGAGTGNTRNNKNNNYMRPQGIPIRGGDEEIFSVQPGVSQVRVVLQTDGMPLYARLELLRQYGDRQFLGDVFRDIDQGHFETVINTYDMNSKLRIVNTGPTEYTAYAWLEPYSYESGRGEYYGPTRGNYGGSRGNYNSYGQSSRRDNRSARYSSRRPNSGNYISPYNSYQSNSRFDADGRIRSW